MTVAQIAKRNISLTEKFSEYIVKNPKRAYAIEAKASIIVLPKNDKRLEKENKKMLENVTGGIKTVYIAKELHKGWKISKYTKKIVNK